MFLFEINFLKMFKIVTFLSSVLFVNTFLEEQNLDLTVKNIIFCQICIKHNPSDNLNFSIFTWAIYISFPIRRVITVFFLSTLKFFFYICRYFFIDLLAFKLQVFKRISFWPCVFGFFCLYTTWNCYHLYFYLATMSSDKENAINYSHFVSLVCLVLCIGSGNTSFMTIAE